MRSFVTYFSFLPAVFFTSILSSNAIALVFKEQCGKYLYSVEITSPFNMAQKKHFLYSQIKGQKNILFYKTTPGMLLDAACVQNEEKKFLMLFNEQCSGNACVEDIYGIYDPENDKIILNPEDWPDGNSDKVEELLGNHPPILDLEDEGVFCCSKEIGELRWGKHSN